MFLLGPVLIEQSARRSIKRLHKMYGAPALAAAAELPALSAALDQHAAAVRDILEFGVDPDHGTPPVVLLTAYARGLLDQARETAPAPLGPEDSPPGPPAVPVDTAGWSEADWMVLRLAAVCVCGWLIWVFSSNSARPFNRWIIITWASPRPCGGPEHGSRSGPPSWSG
ncbi:DUF6401 family natural product biosynthesis protein, partial [Nocardia cyriacigeorgica]|uniref:DUF6401 family natural product biosynthesis protein n=1 Tax=Nocardia cyriacigeorgica TaxID=135487 RepID=UPI0024538291